MDKKILKVHIVPNSSKNQIIDSWNEDTIKIKLQAPAVDGKANKALISFLSEILNVKKSKISILSGEKSREKTIKIE